MASPTSNLSVITAESDTETSKMNDVSGLLVKDSTANTDNGNIRNLTPTCNNQISSETTSSHQSTDIPQWKKDLIQRRKTSIAKTLAANPGVPFVAHSSKGTVTSNATLGAMSPTSDSKTTLISSKNNNCDKLITTASNTYASDDTKNNTSQHSLAPAANINNILKMPATLQQQQQPDEMESLCGGHYTQAYNKPSVGSHNYNEKFAARTVSVEQEEQPRVPLPRSFGMSEQNRNDASSNLIQENLRFQKNLIKQHETTNSNSSSNSTSSDSLITTSRLSSSLKVSAAAEIYKKSNKDHSVCVSKEQTHTLQEPDLTTKNVSNKNSSGGSDDEQQWPSQLKSEHESDNLVRTSANENQTKEIDSKLFTINNSLNGIITLSPKVALNKKPCGIASASVRSSSSGQSPSSSQFVKNQNIGNSNLVSSHNYKINTKYRLNQSQSPTSSFLVSVSSSATESSSATVTNNKKKMVAVQEMNEIANNELDFDPSEELQYGPGIVSKLRCRYLSLALRQSMGKQRLSMDTLRRATSLNNLLDDNDVNDVDEDDDDNVDTENKEPTSPTSVSTQQPGTEGYMHIPNATAGGFKKNVKIMSGEGNLVAIHLYNNQHRSRHIKRGNDSLKRARSVEALLCEKSPWNFSNSQPTIISNGAATDAVSIEDKINNARDRLISGTDNPPKRLTSIIDDTERPPPDLVKQTLKIFEASANRRGRIVNRNSGGEVATKVANYKSIITQNKPAIVFAKPPVSPKKINTKKNSSEVNKTLPSPPPPPSQSTPPTTPTAMPSLMHLENNLFPLSSTPAASSRTTPAFRQKMEFTPIRNTGYGSVEGLSENTPDIIPRHKLIDKTLPTTIAVDSPVSELTKKIEKLKIESPSNTQTQILTQPKEPQSLFSVESSDRDSEDDDSIDGNYVVNNEEGGSPKQISQSALENIAKAGTSQNFQFQTNKFSESLHDIPSLPTTGATTTVKQIGVIRPLISEPQNIEKNFIGESIEEAVHTQGTSTLTSREIEKNRINDEKKIEKSGITRSMDESGCVAHTKVSNKNSSAPNSASDSSSSGQTPAWSSTIITKKKRIPLGTTPENNTMVFNFKDRKEVPDYIESDGIIFKRKRELPKPNESGFVLLGDLSLETSTDPEDEWPVCPPSPCDVEFENANIIIDGKSSIKNRPKEANFRVQFNDTLTSTFEYPSESSVIENSGSEYADIYSNTFDSTSSTSSASPNHIPANLPNEKNLPIKQHHHVTVDEIIQLPHNNKVLGNLSLGSAPLGNYTPVKAKIENMFQLGVTRVPNSQSGQLGEQIVSTELLAAEYCKELDDPSLEYLKPASDDLTIAYSEGSLKTDLLY